MEFRNGLIRLLAGAALLGVAGSAQALSINMSLIQTAWQNVVIGNPNTLTGVGTNEIKWNMPVDDGDHSGFRFENTSSVSTPANTSFSLGEFTYFNYPAMGENMESADLTFSATIIIDATLVTMNAMSVPFSLHPVSGNCENPNCTRDQIKLKGSPSIGTFNVGGMEYSLDIMGFLIDGKVKNVFHVFDNDQSTASLIAEFRATAIPEPGTFGLFIAGITAMVWSRRRLFAVQAPKPLI
jgi:hypothetical protein